MKKFNVKVNGKSYAVEVEEDGSVQGGFTYQPAQQSPIAAPSPAPTQPAPKAPQGPVSGEEMTAPMPGTILDLKVTEGQKVKAGDIILILEAMKMENEITSPKDGIIAKIYVNKGDTVSTGDSLVIVG